MPRHEQAVRDVYVPVDTFCAMGPDGVDVNFIQDRTRVRKDHWAVQKYPHLFEEVRVHYDTEAATAAPGEAR